ncbi:MAG: hypothetical protein AB7S26_38265 [Sandaracinaceae bacterium]
MGGTRPVGALLALALLASASAGCDRRQPWEITNGSGLGPERPPLIIAEVYQGGQCGPCEPVGSRSYCAQITDEGRAPAPIGLQNGEGYCFMATALDAAGNAYGIGCQVAEAGAGPIRITLAPILPGRFIVPICEQGTSVGFDASFPDAGPPDAGPPDAGPPGLDAGPPRDAGPGLDAGPGGPPVGTPVNVRFSTVGDGAAYLFIHSTGQLLGEIPPAPGYGQLTAEVGDMMRIEAQPSAGSRLSNIYGGGCGTQNPCVMRVSGSENVNVVFDTL